MSGMIMVNAVLLLRPTLHSTSHARIHRLHSRHISGRGFLLLIGTSLRYHL